MIIKEELVKVARQQGVDLVGVAPVARLAGAPAGHRPTDLMPTARSVIVMAKRLLREALTNQSRLTFYLPQIERSFQVLDRAALEVALFLEDQGGRALPVPADSPYTEWDAERMHGAGELSHKHAAVAAGLGIMGKNTLLVTPQYGNRVHLVSVITDLAIEPDPLCEKQLCLEGCRRCIEACPAKAIQEDGTVSQKRCREIIGKTLDRGFFVYACRECRRVCPHGGGGRDE